MRIYFKMGKNYYFGNGPTIGQNTVYIIDILYFAQCDLFENLTAP